MALETPSDVFPLITDIKAGYNSTEGRPFRQDELQANGDDSDSSSSEEEDHKTTVWQTLIHLLKGYMGAGCLSLPWAVSQLGITGGCIAVATMSYWSSYNCWTVVKLKRYVEKTSYVDEKASEASSVTYADVGDWAYGASFQSYVTACICVQQLAVCTVFFSFIGENLLAVLQRLNVQVLSTHMAVMTMALPFIMCLSFIPSLKTLAPVMAVAIGLLLVTFATLGIIIVHQWSDRPEETPDVNPPQIPLALCAILYSYEGICLILPVESAMKEPKHFKKVFLWSMGTVAFILASFSSICVLAFGEVTNGSVTAFLLVAFRDDPSITWLLMIANTAVSLSVLLSYPLQLFPAVELMGLWLSQKLPLDKTLELPEEEEDLSGFEPLPPLPEHDTASLDSLPATEHQYGVEEEKENEEKGNDDDSIAARSQSLISSVRSVFPKMTMPGDSPQLRAALVLFTYMVAVAVPNVQALISLAGALAGSSIALLIPPILELAWIKHLECDLPESAADDGVEESSWMIAPLTAPWGRWWEEKAKCYFLLFIGLIFFVIGTYASLADIVRIYRTGG